MTLAPGPANCNVTVTFQPTSAGRHSAKLTITDSGSPGSTTVTLRGAGREGQLMLSTHALSFSAAAGSAATPQSVTLTNPNPIPMTLGTIALAPHSGSGFSLPGSGQPCGSTMAKLAAQPGPISIACPVSVPH